MKELEDDWCSLVYLTRRKKIEAKSDEAQRGRDFNYLLSLRLRPSPY